jgi:cell division septal protein FtsQ
MAKKRKRSGKGGKMFSSLFSGIGAFFKFSLKVIPIFFLVFMAGGLFMGVRAALYRDTSLAIQKIKVEPPEALAPAQRDMLETALSGRNILKVDISKVANSLEQDPWIQSARVVKSLPSTLVFKIQRREPIGFLRLAPGGPLALVSADGTVLDDAAVKTADGLIIEAVEPDVKSASKGFHVTARGFQECVKFLQAFEKHPMAQYEKVTFLSYDRIGNVDVMLGKGPRIRLGRRPAEVIPSFEKIMALLQGPDRDKIEYIDLQFDNVIVKQRK